MRVPVARTSRAGDVLDLAQELAGPVSRSWLRQSHAQAALAVAVLCADRLHQLGGRAPEGVLNKAFQIFGNSTRQLADSGEVAA